MFTSIRSRLIVALVTVAGVAFLGSFFGMMGLSRMSGALSQVATRVWPTADMCMEYWIGSLEKIGAKYRYAQGDVGEALQERDWARRFVDNSLQRLERMGGLRESTLDAMVELHQETDRELETFFQAVDRESELAGEEATATEELMAVLRSYQDEASPRSDLSVVVTGLSLALMQRRHASVHKTLFRRARWREGGAVAVGVDLSNLASHLSMLRAAGLQSDTLAGFEETLARHESAMAALVEARRQRELADIALDDSVARLKTLIAPIEESMDLAMDEAGRDSAESARRTGITLGLVAIGSLAAAILLGLGMTKSIVSPLKRLTDMTARLAQGKWVGSAGIQRKDEIGVLASRFDGMACELARSHKCLKASEMRYRGLFEYARVGLVVLCPAGMILDANNAFKKMTGADGTSLEGVLFQKFLPPEDRDGVGVLLTRLSDPDGERTEIRLCRPDQSSRPVDVGAVQLPDGRSLLVLRDLSRRRQMEQALVQGEKLRAIGQLAAGVAHELRNPLFVISNVLYDLRQTLSLREGEIAESLSMAEQESRRARKIISNLLEFARPVEAEVREMEVESTIEQALCIFRSSLKHCGVNLDVQFQSRQMCRFHPDAFKQIMVNLLSNAIDAMPDGGQLNIATSDGVGRWVQVRVEDTGDGIPADQQKEIFNPFFTTKAPGRGTGLGLWIVHSTVARYGGRVHFSSAEGRGTTFTLDLPSVEAVRC